MTLAATQQSMYDYLIANKLDALQALVLDNTDLKLNTRLRIYYDGYRLRLIDTLAEDFPKLKSFMGDDRFEALAREYIDKYPSRFFTLRHFGKRFPQFLYNHSSYQHHLYLGELAQFEWALSNTLDATDAASLTFEHFSSLPAEKWPDLKIQFHPSVILLKLYWDMPQIWHAIDQAEEERDPKTCAKPQAWLLYRKAYTSFFRSCSEDEAFALAYMQAKHNFAELCAALCERMSEDKVANFALGYLKLWLDEGLIVQGH